MFLELIDLENTSGDPTITRIYGEGGGNNIFQPVAANIDINYRVQAEAYSVPVVIRALGTSLTGIRSGDRNTDPYLYQDFDEPFHVSNNDWQTTNRALALSGYG